MQQRAPIQVRFVKIKLSVFVPAWGNGTGREHEIFCVSAETENITWILLMLHADKSLSFRLVSKCLICDYNGYFQNNILSLNFNPFAPGDFAEKRVLKLVEWFSGHCRARKS